MNYKVYIKRPATNEGTLTAEDMLLCDIFILSNLEFWEAYKLVFGETTVYKGKVTVKTTQAIKRQAEIYSSRSELREYLEKRSKQLAALVAADGPSISPNKLKEVAKSEDGTGFSAGFASNVIRKIEEAVDEPTSPIHFDAIKLAATKVMKDLEVKDNFEPPVRYLPETCSNCRCKKFCEDNCEDLCKLCRYREFAESQGVHYEDNDMLNTIKDK